MVLLLASTASCEWGPSTFGCGAREPIDDALWEVVALWPEVEPVTRRLDLFCDIDEAKLQSSSYCGRSGATSIRACTMWLGSTWRRARMYVARGEDVVAAINHEAQHWHLELTNDDACRTHDDGCGWVDLTTRGRLPSQR